MKHSLDRKMDRILERENSGRIKKGIRNRALRKLFANRLSVLGFIIFIVILVMCLGAPLFTQYSATKVDLRNILSPPTSSHIFGTDKIGRDIWARILYGGRISIGVGLGSALVATVLGVSLGTMAGYKGGWFDGDYHEGFRNTDVISPDYIGSDSCDHYGPEPVESDIHFFHHRMAFHVPYGQVPDAVAEGGGVCTGSKGFWYRKHEDCLCTYASQCHRTYFRKYHIVYGHVYPAGGILKLLGLGVPLEVATWGNILNAAQDLMILKNSWWVWLPAGIVVTLFVVGINFIGDGLRDATDPSQIG